MEISTIKDGEISIKGNIKTIPDYEDIKRVVKEHMSKGIKTIDIKIEDSSSITSSVIGFFLKAKNKDKINLNLYIKDERLFKIVRDLNLLELFNVSKI